MKTMDTNYDVIFCVFGCATIEKYKNQILKINETWGSTIKSYNFKILFFLGEEKTNLIGPEYIYLEGIQNDMLSASQKQNLGLKYIYETHTCNFIFICGTDTYVVTKALKEKTKDWNRNENICIGGHGETRQINGIQTYFHSGGAGIIISFKTLSIIYSELDNMYQNWISENIDHILDCACDVALCYYLKIKNCRFIKEDDLFFGCNYVGYPPYHPHCYKHQGLKTNIIACHYMSLSDFDNYTQILKSEDTRLRIIDARVINQSCLLLLSANSLYINTM
jgi:hypothetical protein